MVSLKSNIWMIIWSVYSQILTRKRKMKGQYESNKNNLSLEIIYFIISFYFFNQ